MSLTDQPDEIIVEQLRQLSISDLLQTCQTNKKLHDVCNKKYLWRKLIFDLDPKDTTNPEDPRDYYLNTMHYNGPIYIHRQNTEPELLVNNNYIPRRELFDYVRDMLSVGYVAIYSDINIPYRYGDDDMVFEIVYWQDRQKIYRNDVVSISQVSQIDIIEIGAGKQSINIVSQKIKYYEKELFEIHKSNNTEFYQSYQRRFTKLYRETLNKTKVAFISGIPEADPNRQHILDSIIKTTARVIGDDFTVLGFKDKQDFIDFQTDIIQSMDSGQLRRTEILLSLVYGDDVIFIHDRKEVTPDAMAFNSFGIPVFMTK